MKKLAFLFTFLISALGFGQNACQYFKSTTSSGTPNINTNARSDTFDILHTALEIDFTRLPSRLMYGKAEISVFKKIASATQLNLDLEGPTVDSVFINGNASLSSPIPRGFSVNLPGNSDTLNVVVYYSGQTITDPTNWGGFHISSPYFFNLGVGFGVNPHAFGRAWFPTFDNFAERSTFEFAIKTASGRKAYCNGQRTGIDVLNGDTVVSYWAEDSPLPSYLVSVAISNYAELEGIYNTPQGPVPYMLMALSGDTVDLKSSFVHLPQTLNAFINAFGPYVWEKVGYVMTSQGAMEHAGSIHFPIGLVDGSLSGEGIMAHELAHHWWGDLITCASAEDMWINEGMAEFSSHLYLEYVYDYNRYISEVRDNQYHVLNFAHVQDGGYLALNGVDHGTTYGMHVYQKGAWVGHNLRGYLGDSTFFGALNRLFTEYQFNFFTSTSFRDTLEYLTGKDLHPFFEDWVFSAGHPQFAIDSLVPAPTLPPGYSCYVGVSQRVFQRQNKATNVPLSIAFKDKLGNVEIREFTYLNQDTVLHFNLPFTPDFAMLNGNSKVLTGTTWDELWVKNSGTQNLQKSEVQLDVQSITDSILFLSEEHWAGPSGTANGYRLSKSHYWRFTGAWDANFNAKLRMFYDGRIPNGGLDRDLVGQNEDSIVLLYRPDSRFEWVLYPDYNKFTMGSTTNAYGYMEITHLIPGEYTFANQRADIGFIERNQKSDRLKVFPNPNKGIFTVTVQSESDRNLQLRVYNASGQLINHLEWEVSKGENRRTLEIQGPDGLYYIEADHHQQSVIKAN